MAAKVLALEQEPEGYARVSIVEKCRPMVVADKKRPNDEQLSLKRELFKKLSCVELPNIAAHARPPPPPLS